MSNIVFSGLWLVDIKDRCYLPGFLFPHPLYPSLTLLILANSLILDATTSSFARRESCLLSVGLLPLAVGSLFSTPLTLSRLFIPIAFTNRPLMALDLSQASASGIVSCTSPTIIARIASLIALVAFGPTATPSRKRHPAPSPTTPSPTCLSPPVTRTSSTNRSHADFTPPHFTMAELFAAVPARCFERSTLKSASYVVRDLVLWGIFVAIVKEVEKTRWWLPGWVAYGYFTGLVWTGLWVIGHECGHQAFSPSKTVNFVVGWAIHSALLVPFFSWRITHQGHHASIGHMERDQTFIPKTRSEVGLPPLDDNASQADRGGSHDESWCEKLDDLLEDAPLWSFIQLVAQQFFGWPLYILTNASGQRKYPAWTNHFNPNSVLFKPQHRREIFLSDIGVALTLAGLSWFGYTYGFGALLRYYIVPYFWVNHWLVMVTFLQHTDETLPHYRSGQYTFQRGALCTMDRQVHGWWLHGIAETHLAHHLFARIPHYNAWEATEALKVKLGPYYNSTDEDPWVSLWKTYRHCRFVEDTGDVVFYKNAKGQAKRRLAPSDSVSISPPTQTLNLMGGVRC